MTPTLTTGTITSLVIRTGDRVISMTSQDPWFRLFRAAADLFIAGEIDACTLNGEATGWYVTSDRRLREFTCPAAKYLVSTIISVLAEPPCVCWAYWEAPPCTKGCRQLTDDDRREHLRELIGP